MLLLKKNRLGKSDIFVSALTLGCMSLGTDKQKAIKMIHQAIDAGINHLDTADLYDFGMNEEIVGAAIKQKREQIVLTTKVGNHFDTQTKSWYWDPSKKYIEAAVEKSLRRLETDYIDLYLLHGGTIEDRSEETIETFEKLKRKGIIRAYGISSIRPNVIAEYVKHANIDAVMMQYSLLDRRPEPLLKMLAEHRISVLARGPLAKGLLTNHPLQQLAKKEQQGFLQYSEKELQQTLQKLLTLKEPITKLALQYILTHPTVATALFGASSMNQLEENLQYKNVTPMNNELYNKLQKITKQFVYTDHQII